MTAYVVRDAAGVAVHLSDGLSFAVEAYARAGGLGWTIEAVDLDDPIEAAPDTPGAAECGECGMAWFGGGKSCPWADQHQTDDDPPDPVVSLVTAWRGMLDFSEGVTGPVSADPSRYSRGYVDGWRDALETAANELAAAVEARR